MNHHRSNVTAQAADSQDADDPDPFADIWLELHDIKENMNKKETKIEELNDLLKNAHITINRLNDRISTLEEQIIRQQFPSPVNMDDEKTLLLGDDNLNEVRLSDLEDGCSVKTIKDSTVDLLQCWVNEKLEWAPDKCIIYCGMNDLVDADDVGKILDDFGNLTSELKNKNENIEVFACELAPNLKNDLDVKINNFNNKLGEWSNVNGIKLIKTNLNFKLGTGEIDELCFNTECEENNVNMNRYGTQRLLSAISKQCKFLKLSENFHRNKNRPPSNKYNSREVPATRDRMNGQRYGYSRDRRQNTGNENTRNRFNHRIPNNRQNHHYVPYDSDRQHHSSNRQINTESRNGCYNCGEYNHRQSTCRYDHRIRCNQCYQLGHKSRICNFQNY